MAKITLSQIRYGADAYFFAYDTICTGNVSDWDFKETPTCPIGCDCRVRDIDGCYLDRSYCCGNEDPNNPDDDTYVFASKDSEELILFDGRNHTTESGTINYVEVVARAKMVNSMAENDEFYIIISPNSACTDYHSSNDLSLTTTFRNYGVIYTTNPETSNEWSWADIDALAFGLKSNLTKTNQTFNTTFRPNGAGTYSELIPEPTVVNYLNVDETVIDYDTTKNVNDTDEAWKKDTYALENHTTESGTIHSVTIYAYLRSSATPPFQSRAKLCAYINGTLYESGIISLSNSWQLKSYKMDVNPDTAIAWTWNDIDNMEAGVNLYIDDLGTATADETRVSQVYIVVNHTENTFQSEVRVSQEYIRVNYDADITCNLSKPETISCNHSKNIKMLNFWNGEREVYSLSRNRKTLILTGGEYTNDACTNIECVRGMGTCGENVTISGLNMYIFNDTFKIRSFGWEAISENPKFYRWILELEWAT